ncbi:hypothetical protein ABZ470_31940 [Streptosporangium sp. NPDC020072]|uniref:hypothetical protein n=1 Tax=Streptosporangium sp. NPDC020072 TaxID=3154788 RepID=UPI003443A75B
MGNRSKALGYTYEVAVKDFFADLFAAVKRNGNQYGPNDRGDIDGVPGWTLQLKNTAEDKWGTWFEATATQAVNNETRWWAVIRKMRGKNVKDSLFVMPLWKAKEMIAHMNQLENQLKEKTV